MCKGCENWIYRAVSFYQPILGDSDSIELSQCALWYFAFLDYFNVINCLKGEQKAPIDDVDAIWTTLYICQY